MRPSTEWDWFRCVPRPGKGPLDGLTENIGWVTAEETSSIYNLYLWYINWHDWWKHQCNISCLGWASCWPWRVNGLLMSYFGLRLRSISDSCKESNIGNNWKTRVEIVAWVEVSRVWFSSIQKWTLQVLHFIFCRQITSKSAEIELEELKVHFAFNLQGCLGMVKRSNETWHIRYEQLVHYMHMHMHMQHDL